MTFLQTLRHQLFTHTLPLLTGLVMLGGQTAIGAEPSLNNSSHPKLILGSPLPTGQLVQRYWTVGKQMAGLATQTPVLIANGSQAGPTLCLTAAVHGDELNGVEIVRRVLYGIDPQALKGTVIGVPIVNLHGFHRQSRYLPDRRDLNRFFPGNPQGSTAGRVAHALFTQVISHCDWLIDIHTGSHHRTNMTQLRANMQRPEVAELSHMFGGVVVLHSLGAEGTLRTAASNASIPTVTLEVGEPLHLQQAQVQESVEGIQTVIQSLGLSSTTVAQAKPSEVYYQSSWLRADQHGVLFSQVPLGAEVEKGQLLGTVTDPISNRRSRIYASAQGRILGMALDQMVMPGFATHHLGIAPKQTKAADLAVDSQSNRRVGLFKRSGTGKHTATK